MRILGIHDGHNASLCLLEDGKLTFAIQEERLTYQKNKSGFPKASLNFLFSSRKLTPNDIDLVAMASEHTSPEFASGEYFESHKKSNLRRYAEHAVKKTPIYFLYKTKRRKERVQELLNFGFAEKNIHFIEHHLCHAATAYYGSNFPRDQKSEEKVLVLTNDGAGDGLCATVSIGYKGRLQRLAEIKSSDSLAAIYCLVTKMLGFTPLEHEYKLMGMAPYCSEKGTAQGYAVFKDLIVCSSENTLLFKRTTSEPVGMLMNKIIERSKFVRMDNLCAGLQKFTEEVLTQWVDNCIKQTGINRVALAGGIFMNVKANKRIMELDSVRELFIFPSCGDETVCMGAAYQLYFDKKSSDQAEIEPLSNFYLGSDFSDEEALQEIAEFKEKMKDKVAFNFSKQKKIEQKAASLLAKGQVVARCKGRMEFGARALGNRSLLADPGNLNCVRELNLMLKNRDFWMPFAPVILQERAKDYLVNPKNINSPYMIMSFDTTEKYPELMAAVHQADLTARPQIINKKTNPDYYTIIKEFEKLTGRGVLLNTSFNLHGFPMVRGPREALEVFCNSGINYLVLGNYLVEKSTQRKNRGTL